MYLQDADADFFLNNKNVRGIKLQPHCLDIIMSWNNLLSYQFSNHKWHIAVLQNLILSATANPVK